MNTNSNSRQLDNPVYDGSAGTHSQTNYISTGPAYEHVEANEGTGYDVINRRGAPRPHPPMTPLDHMTPHQTRTTVYWRGTTTMCWSQAT